MTAAAIPCVRLTHGGTGRSHLGGSPRLDGDWPRFQGRPLSFLAQLDLAEVRAAGGPDWAPDHGLLLVFYELEHGAWGFDPQDAGSFRVVHVDGLAAPADAPPDLGPEQRFPERPVTLATALSYPDTERLDVDWTRLSESDQLALDAAIAALSPGALLHQIGGYPSPVQSDGMELDCQLVTNGVYVGNTKAYTQKAAEALKPGAANWRLLLQLDTDGDAGMMWGDMGRLYFWIREQDARAADFSKVWMVLQCS